MSNRTASGFLLLALVAGTSACDSGVALRPTISGPTSPSPTAAPPPVSAVSIVSDVTVSGVVYERTLTGDVPIAGVHISNGEGPFRMEPQLTDENGFFSFRRVWVCPCAGDPGNGPVPAGMTYLILRKNGYGDPPGLPESVFRPHDTGYHDLMIDGNTHVRLQLVKK